MLGAPPLEAAVVSGGVTVAVASGESLPPQAPIAKANTNNKSPNDDFARSMVRAATDEYLRRLKFARPIVSQCEGQPEVTRDTLGEGHQWYLPREQTRTRSLESGGDGGIPPD